eukprot:4596897-Pleurochrysis_carterae.AAC.3
MPASTTVVRMTEPALSNVTTALVSTTAKLATEDSYSSIWRTREEHTQVPHARAMNGGKEFVERKRERKETARNWEVERVEGRWCVKRRQ